MGTAKTSILRLENVWKTYNMGEAEVTALRGVSTQIEKGDFVAIVNASTVFFAIGISVLIGMAAGIVPAWNASKLKPVDALRYE